MLCDPGDIVDEVAEQPAAGFVALHRGLLFGHQGGRAGHIPGICGLVRECRQ